MIPPQKSQDWYEDALTPKKHFGLQVDASEKDLAAVLLKNEKPIAYTSISLAETEQNSRK